MVKRGGKGLLPKSESSKEFAVRTKIKYANCMDPLLEGDKLQPGELETLCCVATHECVTDFSLMSEKDKDAHLCSLIGHNEGYKSDKYMRKCGYAFL